MQNNCSIEDNVYTPHCGISLKDYCRRTNQLGRAGLEKEYKQVISRDLITLSCEAFTCNPYKNRYLDVPCLDNQRVVLTDGEGGNYIHANYVHGYGHHNTYILAQGPKHNTCNDFWRMIWQERSHVVVSLTRLMESENEKCFPYWPLEEGKAKRYKNITVKNREIIKKSNYELSKLKLTNSKDNQVRNVHHLLYLQWPDFTPPVNSLGFQTLLDDIEHLQKSETEAMISSQPHKPSETVTSQHHTNISCDHGPSIVIHCSAGVGRSGTLVALDICRKKILHTGKVDVPQVVQSIRSQRAMAVQKVDQYVFLNLALLEFTLNQGLILPSALQLTNFRATDHDSETSDQHRGSILEPHDSSQAASVVNTDSKEAIPHFKAVHHSTPTHPPIPPQSCGANSLVQLRKNDSHAESPHDSPNTNNNINIDIKSQNSQKHMISDAILYPYVKMGQHRSIPAKEITYISKNTGKNTKTS